MDNRHDDLGKILRKGGTKTAPPDLSATIMQKITALEHRRIYRRLVGTFVMKFLVVFGAFALLTMIFLPRIQKLDLAAEITQAPEQLYQVGFYLSHHIFLIFGLIALLLFSRRVLSSKTAY